MEDSDIDTLITQALAALEKGFPSSTVLEELLKHVPENKKDEIRKRFNREVVAWTNKPKAVKEKTEQEAQKSSLASVLSMLTQGVADRFRKLCGAKPDINKAVQEAGQVFTKYGLTVHRTTISTEELGSLSPMIGLGVGKQKDTGKGV